MLGGSEPDACCIRDGNRPAGLDRSTILPACRPISGPEAQVFYKILRPCRVNAGGLG